jgi:hypothetical protein
MSLFMQCYRNVNPPGLPGGLAKTYAENLLELLGVMLLMSMAMFHFFLM